MAKVWVTEGIPPGIVACSTHGPLASPKPMLQDGDHARHVESDRLGQGRDRTEGRRQVRHAPDRRDQTVRER
ncbi:MAG: hypothetical protein R3A46_16600 [Thermomicrobiales bacterium]